MFYATGPPGTGKTSLCKALPQKRSILLSDRYRYGQLIEINSHSLFSKWFSEVMILFILVSVYFLEVLDPVFFSPNCYVYYKVTLLCLRKVTVTFTVNLHCYHSYVYREYNRVTLC